jgi:predicted alpha/beta-fold hydrolase
MNAEFFPPFHPLPSLASGHAQTLATVLPFSRKPVSTTTPHLVKLPDGDHIVLHDDYPPDWEKRDPVALLVHGLSGSHSSSYMVNTADRLTRSGVRTFRMDQRGCGAGVGLAKLPYHAGRSEDVAGAVEAIAGLCPGSPVKLVGFSLGGNMTLKLVGERADGLPANLEAVMAVCPAIDLAAASVALHRGWNRWLYETHLVKALLRTMSQWPAHVANCQPEFSRIRTIHDVMRWFVTPVWGFGTVDRYYSTSSAGPLLPAIRVPTLVLASQDDPIVPFSCFAGARLSPTTRFAVVPHGGHLGFFGRAVPPDPDCHWLAWRVVDWVKGDKAVVE